MKVKTVAEVLLGAQALRFNSCGRLPNQNSYTDYEGAICTLDERHISLEEAEAAIQILRMYRDAVAKENAGKDII